MIRKAIGTLVVVVGIFFVVTFQGWGFCLIDVIGPERALGSHAVRREPDGSVLMTNPVAMLFWSLPFIVIGLAFIIVGVKVFRGSWRAK